jgi:hypothetical protein
MYAIMFGKCYSALETNTSKLHLREQTSFRVTQIGVEIAEPSADEHVVMFP